MLNTNQKVFLISSGIIIIGSIISAHTWGRIQYYQGRIDAHNVMMKELERIKIEVEQEIKEKNGEA